MLNKFIPSCASVCVRHAHRPVIFRQCHAQPGPASIARTVQVAASELPRRVRVQGWVKSVRKQKQNTFLDLGDGTSGRHLQVVAATELLPASLNFHSCVGVEGELVESGHPQQEVELRASSLQLVTSCAESYPFQPRTFAKPEFVRRQPGCKAKTNSVSSLLRLRNAASQAVHEHFQAREFLQIHTPVLTSNDCEGGGEVFTVTPPAAEGAEQYWDTPVHLTVSGQLHLEAVCNGLARVYTFNPAFRAERGRTRRHLSEFWMVEAEMAFTDDLQTIIDTMESLVKHTAAKLLDSCSADLEVYAKATKGRSTVPLIEKLLASEVVVLPYSEAAALLARVPELGPLVGGDLGREHEQWLCEHAGGAPVAVTNWPADIKPFYMRTLDTEPDKVAGVDLLVPGVSQVLKIVFICNKNICQVGELCGGSLREPSYEVLAARLGRVPDHGLDWYLELRQQGAAHTGGFGLGFERLLQFLIGVENIKDTLPFHRAPHSCML